MACTHAYWSSLQVGSQHLARQFAQHNYDVHYFSAPITPFHMIRIKYPEVRKRIWQSFQKPLRCSENGIWSYIPFSLAAPDAVFGLRHSLVTSHWYKTILPKIATLLNGNGLNRVHILYIDNLSYHFLLDHVVYDKCVFRVMDMHEHFPGWKGKTREMAQKIAKKADLTIYSAKGLKSYVDSLSPQKTALVPNGVDFDFFNSKDIPTERHPLLNSIPDPVFLYTGAIDSRIDIELIRKAANEIPNATFMFTGPKMLKSNNDGLPDNIHFSGPVPHKELPQLMKSAKAGIIPFDIKNRMDLIQGIRPLKLLEYLAAGLPVICARWPEVEGMKSPALLYNNGQEFETLIRNIDFLTHDPQLALNFARKNNWENAFQLLMRAIGNI